MDMRGFQGTCVGNPFDDIDILCQVIEDAREITKQTFLRRCDVYPDTKKEFTKWPRDYTFYKNKNVYFYTWSCIEHFYYYN